MAKRSAIMILVAFVVASPAAPALAQGGCIDYVPEVLGEVDIPDGLTPDIVINGDYAYVAAQASGVLIYDISDPTAPVSAGSVSVTWAYEIALAGNLLLVGTNAELVVLSVASPGSPAYLGSVPLSGGVTGMAVAQSSSDYAYLSVARLDDTRGLQIVDIRNPASPALSGFFEFYFVPGPIAVVGNHAYVGQNFDGMKVINVSNPASPSLVTNFLPPTGEGYSDLAHSSEPGLENYLFGVPQGPNRIDVIDISTPASPVRSTYLLSTFKNLSMSDGILYTAGYTGFPNGGVQVIDVSTPTSPAIAATAPLPYFPTAIFVSDGIGCVTGPDSGGTNDVMYVMSMTAPVGAVTGLTPASGTSCVSTDGVQLGWSAAQGATSYEVQIGPSCGSGTTFTTANTNLFVPGLTATQMYLWRVRGVNECGGVGAWSDCNSFTTELGPLPAPFLLTPTDGAPDQPTSVPLIWEMMPGAASYDVQVGTTCGTGPIANTTSFGYTAADLTRGETYYWRVRTRNECDVVGNWGTCFSFTVIPLNTPTGTGVVVDPGDDLTLTFDEVTGGGDTSVATSDTNPGPDVNSYMFMGTFYDITTTATYEGEVEVCIQYDDTGMSQAQEDGLRLFHLEGVTWVDITTVRDTHNNIICGRTTSLSPFGAALFMPWMPDGTTPALAMTENTVGVSWGDYDGDGDPDLYVANHMQADKVFRNEGAGVFTDVTAAPLGHTGQGSVGSWADYDNDGDKDLYLTVRGGPNILYENTEYGFVDVTAAPLNDAGESHGAAWFDYDGDGDLDVYVSNYLEANRLYRNDGGGVFVDVTAAPIDDTGQTSGAAVADYDDDGDPDLYVTNTGAQPNRLFRNDGAGVWTDVTPAALGITTESRGAAWGDYDNDGDLDLYVANGNGANQLFRNDGSTVFTDVSAGVQADAGSARGVGWQDYDNDGDLDLYIANLNSANKLLQNQGFGIFTDETISPLDDAGYGIGMAWADYDGDGDSDLYLGNSFGPNVLFRNDLALANHWLHVRLTSAVSNRSGIGARVRVVAGALDQIREVQCGSGYVSEGSLAAEFGLGLNATVDLIEVYWPSGTVTSIATGIGIDRVITVAEGATGVPELPGVTRLYAPRPNPFNPRTTISFDLAVAGSVNLRVYDSKGRLVRTILDGVHYEAGTWHPVWNGTDSSGSSVASGVYHVRFEAPGKVETRSVTLIR